MKKITGFFLALLPIFVIVLMFISGMIVKQYKHVFVDAVEFVQDSVSIQKINDDETYTFQLDTVVLPHNASNPNINFYSSNDDVISIDQNGLVTANDFGEAYVYAVAEENETINAECKIEVWDDKIHRIDVRNDIEARYLGVNQSVLLDAVPVPSTRLKEDPTLSFKVAEGDEDYISVSEDGDVKSKGKETEIGQEVTVNITTASGAIEKDFKMQIGEGVTAIDLNNPANETIKSDTYNLFDQISFYPESSPQRIKPDDFRYTTDNSDVASIDTTGNIKFNQPGTATFTAKYLRGDDNLSVSKTLTSTCSYLLDVAFNRYNFEGSLDEYKDSDIPFDEVNWHLYPEQAQANDDNITITSSDEEIVSVGNNKRLHVHEKAGYATITAEYKVPGEEVTKKDYCVIHIYDKDASVSFVKEPAITIDNLCYPLRQNIKTDELIDENQDVTYASSDESIAIVDQDKELLNFKQSGKPVTITVSSTGKEPQSFTVTSNASMELNPVNIDFSWTDIPTIKLEVGKIYYFTNDLYLDVFAYWDNKYYNNNFIHGGAGTILDPHWFIPKAGGVFPEAVVYNGLETDYQIINLIIHQDPVPNMIRAKQGFPYYSAFSQAVRTSDIISVYPKTATTIDGEPIKPDFTFDEINPGEAWIDDDGETINYIQSVNVGVHATFGMASGDYVIKSTLGSFGKFVLDDPDTNRVIQSGESYELQPNSTKVFALDTSYTHDIQIDPTSPTFNPNDYFTIEDEGGNLDLNNTKVTYDTANNTFVFTLVTKFEANGTDVIKISSKSFTFYINLNIGPYITGFNLYHYGTKLNKGTDATNVNIAYYKELILSINIYPLKAIEESYSVKLNDHDITEFISDYKIDFAKEEISSKLKPDGQNNEIVITSEHGYLETYLLQFQDEPEDIDFTIKEANRDNIVYLPCGSLRCGLTIQVKGLVKEDFYDQFTISNYQPKAKETAVKDSNIKNKIIIRNIAAPTRYEPGFNNNISITFTPKSGGAPTTKTFTMDRDVISKVVLPKHDNADVWDQRGLQKVHVYGNQSFYNPQEGLIDFYKLPIDIYDYEGNLINNPSQKEKAFNLLDVSVTCPTTPRTTWKYQDGYVLIQFDKFNLYTQQDIYDNKFVNGQKNVLFKVSTYSGYAGAQYEFVPVEGINAYCKQAIDNDRTVVLQTNFGLEGAVKDNTPFDDVRLYNLNGIYGNGYTINFDASSRAATENDNDVGIGFMLNTTLQGCHDTDTKSSILDLQTNGAYQHPKLFAYDTIRNLGEGLFIYDDAQPAYVKNCLFYNNYQISINVNADGNLNKTKMYIQDCVMFNCSSAAIDQVLGADIYFKGFIDVYNFRNRDVLKNIMGHDFSFLWDFIRPTLKEENALQNGADGREYMNSYLLQANQGDTYFWDGEDYVKGNAGLPTAAPYLTHFVDASLEPFFSYQAGLWGTPNVSGAPNYYDEFDKDGNLRWDFLNAQIRKLSRQVSHSFLQYI